ncbi:MAG: nucleoside deaminase [Tractidigestivibacter sp.]|jgi:tRNA(Arg) A34 adenosine deaminase TadA|uniref:nucleoside deaminase n=1 Tax=Tractidigestivibacter sp. TaxID=2847320 RepID=UPI003D8A7F9D
MTEDERFMRQAIKVAVSAVKHGNEPFGAVLVKDGSIVFENENQVKTSGDKTMHATSGLIRRYCAQTGIKDLSDYTIYANCEPCFMCCGVIVWAHVGRLVYAATDKDLGKIICDPGSKCADTVFRSSAWEPKVTKGVLRRDSISLLRAYYDRYPHIS